MAKIRHIAILANDQVKVAEFYTSTFEMKEVFRHAAAEGTWAIYLSDGYINLAILPARGRPEGMYHFGFEVDSIDETSRKALAEGATQGPEQVPRDGRFAEVFVLDPVGTRVDLSEKGWKV